MNGMTKKLATETAEKIAGKKILKDKVCVVCGKKFDVGLELNGKIPDRYWFSKDLIKDLTGKTGEYWECEDCSGFKDDKIIEEKVKEFMIRFWGERCPDYEDSCSVCKAWRHFDYIFQKDTIIEKSNPSDMYSEISDNLKLVIELLLDMKKQMTKHEMPSKGEMKE